MIECMGLMEVYIPMSVALGFNIQVERSMLNRGICLEEQGISVIDEDVAFKRDL